MDATEIQVKLEEALDAEAFRAYLKAHFFDPVGMPVVEWACPITRYLNDTVLGPGLWASTGSDKVSVYSMDPAGGGPLSDALVTWKYLPEWAEEFVTHIDTRDNRTEVDGETCLYALNEALAAGDGCRCDYCTDAEETQDDD